MTSERTVQRLTRILSMVPWVLAHPGATASDVMQRFGYRDRAELAKDLDLLFVCGLPGYGPGDLIVAFLDEDEVVIDMADYLSRPLRLTPLEALGLLAAGLALASSTDAPPALGSAVDKLSAALLPDEDVLVVDTGAPTELVDRLRSAAAEQRPVRIVYRSISREETTERVVEPWSVFSSQGQWYLSAFCRRAGAERIFRIDRIAEADELDEAFEAPVGERRTEVRYQAGEGDVEAVVRLRPPARWVIDYYPVEILSEDDDGVRIRFRAADPQLTARLLLRLGPDAELESGPEVAAALSELREALLERYGARRDA